jgi:hypothetical protein
VDNPNISPTWIISFSLKYRFFLITQHQSLHPKKTLDWIISRGGGVNSVLAEGFMD